MNFTSLRLGTRRMMQGSSVSSVAAIRGSTAFFAPLMVTSPCNGTPPLINKLSMKFYLTTDEHGCTQISRDYNSLPLSVILADGFDNPVLAGENVSNRCPLAIAELEHDL